MSKARDIASAAPAPSTVSATELGYVDGVTSAIQTQLNAKQAVVSGVDDTEIGYLNGVTSAIQTQLNQKPEFVAGKNAIINGAFDVWQRGTSNTVPIANFSYTGPDRFLFSRDGSGSVVTVSRQAFTPGTAPVAGYEGNFFARFNQTTAGTGGNYNEFEQRIENVTTFAGQTVTFSFWAKADSSRTMSASLVLTQNFGSGGSSSVNTTITLNSRALTTSWARYTGTVTLPSISGKTIGTSSFLAIDMQLFMNTTFTFDTWGWQLEAGSVATAFQTATGTIQGELSACQRYYFRAGGDEAYQVLGTGITEGSNVLCEIRNPTTLRVKPSSVDFSAVMVYDGTNILSASSVTLGLSSRWISRVTLTPASAPTSFRPYWLFTNNTTSGYIGFSAEL